MARGLNRFARLVVAVTAAATAASGSGCSATNALGLARKACAQVDQSLSIYRKALSQAGTDQARTEQAVALARLRAALPIAASAAGESSQWQALMMTISDSQRIPVDRLVHALEAQCAVADGTGSPTPAGPPVSG